MAEVHHLYRRRIARPQLEVLVQYMERYPALALASARSREGHIQRKRMWEKISRTLNRIDENQARSGLSWHRYWLDLKFKIRRKYSVIQKCQVEGTPCTILLSPLEDRVVKVLTDEKGNLFPTGSVYKQMLQYPLKISSSLKSGQDSKIEDITDINDLTEGAQDDFIASVTNDRLPEHILLPDSSEVKPNVNRIKSVTDIDPIQILSEEKRSIDELRRELLEFELRRQKELFEIEKQHRIEKHEVELSILMIRKEIAIKELKRLYYLLFYLNR